MTKPPYIFDVTDYEGRQVVFVAKKWQEKKEDHPELGKKSFLDALKKAITDPDEVWDDYADKSHRRCYYKKYSQNSYVKAVVWISGNPREVVTAYEINSVKETRYPNLKRHR